MEWIAQGMDWVVFGAMLLGVAGLFIWFIRGSGTSGRYGARYGEPNDPEALDFIRNQNPPAGP